MAMTGSLLYYVSGHGFGHAVRSAEVMRALLRRAPDRRLLVRTTAPAWLFPPQVERARLPVDVGLVQHDSLAHDGAATVERLRDYLEELPRLAEREAAWAASQGVEVVVGDIPPLAFEVAARLGVPGIGLANFSWDGIYRGLQPQPVGLGPLIDAVAAAYSRATLLLRLPFSLPMPAFPSAEDVPLVARRSTRARGETRARLGLAAQQTVVLLSFGGYGLADFDVAALGRLPRYQFVLTAAEHPGPLPANVRPIDSAGVDYVDLVAAVDAVVTKPGYGIVADCLAHRVPVVYTDRPDFPEYPVLAEALERLGQAQHLSHLDLRQGNLGAALEAVLGQDRPWADLRLDGADVAAERILSRRTRA